MASFLRNICAKNYRNLIICFQVTVKNVGDVFWDTVYSRDWLYTMPLRSEPMHT